MASPAMKKYTSQPAVGMGRKNRVSAIKKERTPKITMQDQDGDREGGVEETTRRLPNKLPPLLRQKVVKTK